MERASRAWMCAFLFLAYFSVHGIFGCLDEERGALLQIKESINHPNGTSLPLWNKETNCCNWEEVKCNSTTGRVIELHLNHMRDYHLGDWYLNASLFLPFQELRSLDLFANELAGLMDGEAFERWSNFGNLEILRLGGNNLNNSDRILPYIGAQSSLKALYLAENNMEFSYTGFKRLSKLSKLEKLSLYSNRLNSGVLPYLGAVKTLKYLDIGYNDLDTSPHMEELANLSKLEVLDLSSTYRRTNNSNWRIPSSIAALTSLKELYLSDNYFNDSKSIQGLCKLKNMEVLDLSLNAFYGEIPYCIGNMTNLRILELSDNQFNGRISASLFSRLTVLEYLSLSYNNFSGVFQLSFLANHLKLKVIGLVNGNNVLEVETESSFWAPKFQLKVLQIENCIINRPAGEIPKFLYTQSELRIVQLSNSNLKDTFPNWLLENNTHLETVSLRNNSLMGSFHLPSHSNNTNMFQLDISNNEIYGELPNNIGAILPNLEYLNMSKNAFSGIIPSSFGDLRLLELLDLSHNSLEGGIPEQLVSGCISLNVLKLSNNRLCGQMFSTNSNLISLQLLYLDDNRFNGSITPGSFNSSKLEEFDISNNNISGELPSEIGELSQLSSLILRGNDFKGQIPIDFCKLSQLLILDLSENKLYGQIPSCLNLSNIRHLHLEKNRFSGNLSSALSVSKFMVTLDVRFNRIVGNIPSWIGGLSALRALLLKGNYLQGEIPIELCKLNMLNILDLSCNNIYGSIPSCFDSTTFGGKQVRDNAFQAFGYTLVGVSYPLNSYSIRSEIQFEVRAELNEDETYGDSEVEFVTKWRSNSYKGDILYYMSGIDLSSNQLTGEIPFEIGKLSGLRALNFSHNQLIGPIPRTFSNLTQIESLDLSNNKLSGTIPSELNELSFLAVFTVANNNFHGQIPNMRQFDTFEEQSYEGNPLLCGMPLKRSCFTPHTIQSHEKEDNHDDGTLVFYASFAGSYCVFLLGTIIVCHYNRECAMVLERLILRFTFK